jgi:hypothetical protein
MSIDLVHAFFAVCWIAIAAFTGLFTYALFRWSIALIWPVKTIKVNYFHNGQLVESKIIDLTSQEPLVRQLKRLGGGNHCE